MARADPARASPRHRILLAGHMIEYALVRSKAARRLRVRVGPGGVEAVQPTTREDKELTAFLAKNGEWILQQLDRAKRLRGVHRAVRRPSGVILYRGQPTRVRVVATSSRACGNIVQFVDGEILMLRGPNS